jgi:hypothetical protein
MVYFITTDFNSQGYTAEYQATAFTRTMPHMAETNQAARYPRDDTKKQSKKPKLASHTRDKAIPTTIYDCL